MITDAHILKQQYIDDYSIDGIHPLHSLILDECCETALKLGKHDYSTLSTAVTVAFLTCLSSLKSVIEEGFKEYDTVKIVYRGNQFIFETLHDPALDSARLNFIRHEN
ncbi:hypothetical protein [Cesiribacter andamanensis]|uniref:Uncharacterized protein n=1 Tax=Cesiribacter andamanensis AMV16 TaxID=1279009 RepID=M7N5D5_9BACT|nr:hypothetical protein [Cesiribacter andamanensis]EMR03823.1 hypothetical protein ADICEAN_01066 [Cesiribacter andamanensis AMV16]